MLNSYKNLYQLLSNDERKQAFKLLIMIILMAFFDLVGIASIMPFMAVLANPNLIEENNILAYIYVKLQLNGLINSKQEFFIFIGIVMFFILVGTLLFKSVTTYMQLKFSMMREYSLGRRLIKGYLNQPYSWFLNRHGADLGKNILSEVNSVIDGALIPALNCIAQIAIIITITLMIIIIDPYLAITIGLVLCAAYFAIHKMTHDYTTKIGKERFELNHKRYLAVNDAFGAIKEVKVNGLEDAYINRYDSSAKQYAKHQASEQIIRFVPRYALEAIAFGGMLLVVLYLISSEKGINNALPVIALYVFAGYRLMPALQQVYGSIIQLRFSKNALEFLNNEIKGIKKAETDQIEKNYENINFEYDIKLIDVSYKYPNSNKNALNNVNIKINKGSTIGVIGETGGGKTTVVDIILGILTPTSGHVYVDGIEFNNKKRKQWEKIVGYVPQQIFLIDDSIAANITFGSRKEEIDQTLIEKVAKIANLHDFITAELPQGYETKVGERGIRLSGGQRQRIGIARALYKSPKILVLDESTSALDTITESAVMRSINSNCNDVTIIMIAHRLSTIKICDQIFIIDKGKLIDKGKYDELYEKNLIFKNMVNSK